MTSSAMRSVSSASSKEGTSRGLGAEHARFLSGQSETEGNHSRFLVFLFLGVLAAVRMVNEMRDGLTLAPRPYLFVLFYRLCQRPAGGAEDWHRSERWFWDTRLKTTSEEIP